MVCLQFVVLAILSTGSSCDTKSFIYKTITFHGLAFFKTFYGNNFWGRGSIYHRSGNFHH